MMQIASSWAELQLAFTGAHRVQEMFDETEEVQPSKRTLVYRIKRKVLRLRISIWLFTRSKSA